MTKLLFGALLLQVVSLETSAQTFTRITDPANPIVSDRFNSGGGSWADFNNDGLLDLFVANGNDTSMNNSLYLNDSNGQFIKVAGGSIVNDGGTSIGGTWGDYNNDGNLDLFVTNRQFAIPFGNFLYQGNGDTVFTKITTGGPATDMRNSNSSSWVDIDGDGALDLFVVNFQSDNFLYYSSGPPAYSFTRTDSGAIVVDGAEFSILGVWADYNNDRKPDLFIGNGGNQNNKLFTNNGGGSFVTAMLADGGSTLGASWGDYDNDGNVDLFVANYLGQNNVLYRNEGPPAYSLTRIDTGVVSNDGGFTVGSVWGDFDNDGDLDLFVGNDGQNNAFYSNSGPPDYGFAKLSTGAVANDGGASFGCVAADYDNNGSLDLFVANRVGRENFLYRNEGNGNSWLTVTCVGATNKSGIGAKARTYAILNGVGRWQVREVAAQSGYNSQNLVLHFGLGDALQVDSLVIEWPAGTDDTYSNITVNQHITAIEGGGITSVTGEENDALHDFLLMQNYPNPFNPATVIRFSLSRTEMVSLRVYNSLGQDVALLYEGEMSAGLHARVWNAEGMSSGLYFYSLQVGSARQTRGMIYLR